MSRLSENNSLKIINFMKQFGLLADEEQCNIYLFFLLHDQGTYEQIRGFINTNANPKLMDNLSKLIELQLLSYSPKGYYYIPRVNLISKLKGRVENVIQDTTNEYEREILRQSWVNFEKGDIIEKFFLARDTEETWKRRLELLYTPFNLGNIFGLRKYNLSDMGFKNDQKEMDSTLYKAIASAKSEIVLATYSLATGLWNIGETMQEYIFIDDTGERYYSVWDIIDRQMAGNKKLVVKFFMFHPLSDHLEYTDREYGHPKLIIKGIWDKVYPLKKKYSNRVFIYFYGEDKNLSDMLYLRGQIIDEYLSRAIITQYNDDYTYSTFRGRRYNAPVGSFL